jgi:hypothetical protein
VVKGNQARNHQGWPGLQIHASFRGRHLGVINDYISKKILFDDKNEGYIANCKIFLDMIAGLNYSRESRQPAMVMRRSCPATGQD